MKVAIVGSRTFNNFEKLESDICERINPSEISLIISGGSKGADTLAVEFAKKYNIPRQIFNPDWAKFGNRAGPIRNKKIVAACDILIAFWDGKSKGTKSSIDLAKKYEKGYYIINIKKE